MRTIVILLLVFYSFALSGQEAILSGKIISADNTPVFGAAIFLKRTTLGSVSDSEGNFALRKLKAGSYTLRISFVGYETLEKEISLREGSNYFTFTLNESNLDLNEVVITGTRTEVKLKSVPVITQVISAARMLDLGVTSITDALQSTVSGLNVSQYGTRMSVTLQGMDAKYVLFLVDGERIAGAVNGDIDYSMLNLENIERVEVIKGASSSLYGSNAIGGVINLITKKTATPFDGRIYTRYSAFNELYAGGSAGFKKGILGGRTSFNYSHTDGYDLTPETAHDWTQNPYNSINLSQKFDITPGQSFSLAPYFGFYLFERGNVSTRPAHDLYADFNSGIKARYYRKKNQFTLSYHRDQYNTYTVLEKLDNKRELLANDIIQTFRFQADLHLSERNSLTSGVEFNTENIFTLRIDGSRKGEYEAVFFAQEDFKITEKIQLVGGFRASHHKIYGFNLAPKVSLLYRTGPVNLRTSAGTGFRSPELKELYMNFDHFGEWKIIGNVNLKPESSGYVSASAELLKPWNNSSVTVYSNSLSDMITDRWLPDTVQLTRQYQNISSASVKGIDIMVRQQINRRLWLSSGYSFVSSRDNDSGLQLYGSVKHSGHIAADYTYRKKDYSLNAQINCKLMGEKFYEITDDVIQADRPYSTWKITLSQEYKWARVTAGVDNLFDLVIPGNLNFISPGRRFFAGINIDFGKIALKTNQKK